MTRVKPVVERALAALLVVLMAAAVANVLWQVASRFVLGSPSSFTDELARYLLVWIGLLGAAHAAGQRLHLAVDVLPARLGGRRREALGVLAQACAALFAVAALVVGGSRLVALTWELDQRSAALGIPLGVVYAALPVSGALIAFHSVALGCEHWRALRRAGAPREPAGG